MKRLTYNNLQRSDRYVSPMMSLVEMGIREILCSSKPGSDSIEDMTTGDKFDNWI